MKDDTTRKLHVTFFRNYKATTLTTKVLTIEDLGELILAQTAKTKEKLPWLKLATFGDQKTKDGSLRHNANVISIDGLEADYDEEQISFGEAAAKLEAANLKALLYTSPSHQIDKPRWRILSPTSRPLLPEERTKMLARLNGLFGGVFSGESFTLSQAYYYGSVNGNPAHRCEYYGGDYVDLREDLDAGALGKSDGKDTQGNPLHGFEGFLSQLGDGPGLKGFYKPLRSAIASYVATHSAEFDREALKRRLHEHIERAPKDKERDYLNDDRKIDKLIESAIKSYGEGNDDIQRLNEKHAVLPVGGKARIVTFGEEDEFPGREIIVMTMAFDDFAKIQNKYRHEWTDPKTGETKQTLLGDYWIKSPHRRQYDAGMAFMPHTDEQVFDNKLNLWNGFGVKPVEGDCSLFLEFMCEVICSGDKEHFDYLQKREAFILQNRQRSEIALGLRTDKEGAGKGFYEKTLGYLLGSHWMQVNKPTYVVGKFNPHLEKLLRLTADEALFVGNHEHRNTLFSLITESKVTIEPKFVGAYNAANYLNITLTSNAKHIILASENARRFFIPTVSEHRVTDFDYFAAIQKQLNNGGYQALLYHFLNIDLSDFNVRAVPKTAGLAEQAAYTRNGIEGLVEEVCNVGRVPCPHFAWPGFTITGPYSIDSHGSEYSSFKEWLSKSKDRELRERLSPLMITRRLCSEWGCVAERRRESGDEEKWTHRTNGLQWPPLPELRQRFVERFGRQQWQHADQIEWIETEEAKEKDEVEKKKKAKDEAEMVGAKKETKAKKRGERKIR